jgi:hypothetical protein
MMRGRRADLLAVAGLAGLACLFWGVDVIASGTRVASFISVDLFTEFYPRHALAGAALRRGALPLWDPHQIAGLPFLATLQAGVFYPPNIAYAVLPVGWAMGALAVLHLMLAGAVTYALARRLGSSGAASALAGVTFMLGGSTVSLVYHTNAINSAPWLPAAIYCTWRFWQETRVRWALALAAVLALQFLAGRDYTFVMTVHVVALLGVLQAGWLLRDGAGVRRAAAHVAWLAGAGALAMGLAAVQLLPTLELAARGGRTVGGLPAPLLEIYGPMPPAFFFANLVNPIRGAVRREYLGWVALVCFAIGFRPWGGDRATRFASILALLALLLAFGSQTPLWAAYRYVPLGATFRLPDRFVYVFAFGFALVAAGGFDRVFHGRRRAASLLRVLVLGAAVLALVDSSWVAAGLRRAAAPWGWFMFYGFDAGHFAALGWARWYFLATATLVAVALWRARSPGARAVRAGLPLLAAADLGFAFANGALHPARDATPAVAAAACYERAAQIVGPYGRHLTFRTRNAWALKDKDGELFGTYGATHYEPLVTHRHALYFAALQEGGTDIVRTPWNERSPFMGFLTRIPAPERAGLLDLLGVGAVLVDAAEAAAPPMRALLARMEHAHRCPVAGAGRPLDVDIFRNRFAFPRAFVVHDVEPVDGPAAALARLGAPGFDPLTTALVEGRPPELREGAAPQEPAEARIERYDDVRVTVRGATSRPGLLVLTDSHDPGWEATLNGAPVAVHPTDALFRGVYLPAGEFLVEFRYRPDAFRLGLVVSLTAAALWAAIWARAARRRVG